MPINFAFIYSLFEYVIQIKNANYIDNIMLCTGNGLSFKG